MFLLPETDEDGDLFEVWLLTSSPTEGGRFLLR
jgi:hypothetical protein